MRVKFAPSQGFYPELKRRVDAYFAQTGLPARDCPRMYLKTAVLLTAFVGTYALLVFVAAAWWQALPLAIAMGLALAGIGFNVQHDGGHGSYSRRSFINGATAWTLDVLGGSSYMWHWKHNVFHHSFTNLAGADDDIDGGPLTRFSPHQPRYPVHRFQFLYVWLLYGLLPIKWQFFDDFRDLATGRMGENRFPRPRGLALVGLFAGKALFLTWALVIPLALHPVPVVLTYFLVATYVLGVTLSVCFQLAHCVGEADFPPLPKETTRSEQEWAVHQIRTTVDFARGSRLLSWYFGGLNFQIEHHLFPRICHVHYGAVARIVEATCAEFGVRYTAHRSFWGALRSHIHWLRQLGRPDAVWLGHSASTGGKRLEEPSGLPPLTGLKTQPPLRSVKR